MLSNFVKVYAHPNETITFKHTATVRHNGTVIAFAMDSTCQIWYTVLDLNNADTKSPIDVNYWLKNPRLLPFPKELRRAGQEIANNIEVDQHPEKRDKDKTPEELFLSTTGYLSADAPFKVLSDGQAVYVFRQSFEISYTSKTAWETALANGELLHSDPQARMFWISEEQTLVNGTLLMDRFVLAGTELKLKYESRYQRSRHESRPKAGCQDTLSNKDLEGNPFYEPTLELGIIGKLTDGQFTVLLLPTATPNVQRWQFFVYNAPTQMIDTFNFERTDDGLFNLMGTVNYTSPDHEHRKSVFEPHPGTCPFTGQELIPIRSNYDFALAIHDTADYLEVPDFTWQPNQPATVEFWVKLDAGEVSNSQAFKVGLPDGANRFDLHPTWYGHRKFGLIWGYGNTQVVVDDFGPYMNTWTHVAATSDGISDGTMRVYINGDCRSEGYASEVTETLEGLVIAKHEQKNHLRSYADFRIWNYVRTPEEIQRDMHQPLTGTEDGLMGYWPLNEGPDLYKPEGTPSFVYDLSNNDNHAVIHGEPAWSQHESFGVADRTVTAGFSAELYYQQEMVATGYDKNDKPMKTTARVMLTMATRAGAGESKVTALDFAVSRRGKLARFPQEFELESISSDMEAGTIEEGLDRIHQLEEQIQALELDIIPPLNQQLAAAGGKSPMTGPELEHHCDLLQARVDAVNASGRLEKLDSHEHSEDEWFSIQIEHGTPISVHPMFDRPSGQYFAFHQDASSVPWFMSNAYTDVRVCLAKCPLGGWVLVLERPVIFDVLDARLQAPQWNEPWLGTFFIVLGVDSAEQFQEHSDEYGKYWAGYSFMVTDYKLPQDNIWVGLSCSDLVNRDVSFVNGPAGLASTQQALWKAYLEVSTATSLVMLTFRVNIKLRSENNPDYQLIQDIIDWDQLNAELSRATCQLELEAKERELIENQAELAELKAWYLGDKVFRMPTAYRDPFGLTIGGTVLEFAPAVSCPLIFPSAIGRIGVYFQGTENRFLVTYYNTNNRNVIDTNDTITSVNDWVADGQGNALKFDDEDQAAYAAKNIDRLCIPGDLTLEAWICPHSDSQSGSLIHHQSTNSSYSLGLNQGKVEASVRDKVARVEIKTIPGDKWTHIATTFNQAYALKFDGIDDYLDTPEDESLGINTDLTIEVFLKLDDLPAAGQEYGILTKGRLNDGDDQYVPYALSVTSSGQLVFRFEQEDGTPQELLSSAKLMPGTFHQVTVTRKLQTEESDPETHTVNGKTILVPTGVERGEIVQLTIDCAASTQGHYLQMTGTSRLPLEIGKAYNASGAATFFKGEIGEVRIWNTALNKSRYGCRLLGNEQGLIAWWRFDENAGFVAPDSKGSNHVTISGAKWICNDDPAASVMKIFIDGDSAPVSEDPTSPTDDTSPSFQLGRGFTGIMEETRIWCVERTQEQIQDNMFRRLLGDNRDLVAYYQFDTEGATVLKDCSGKGNHLTIDVDKISFCLSDAPVANETPQARNALTGIQTDFQVTIDGRPAVQEYGDLQYDAEGLQTGVMKRCYSVIKDGEWHLITGFKVGNLITEWVGQAQYDPQLVGYVKGAPPIPGENFTEHVVGADNTFDNCASVEFVEAENVHYTLSASSERNLSTMFEAAASLGMTFGMEQVLAPFGAGITIETLPGVEIAANVKTKLETANSWSNEASMGYGKNITRSMTAATGGSWEKEASNATLGPRYLFNNMGFALVQSYTADIFALRLAHNNALVSYRLAPNPDIPRDWNIIPFALNPFYVKQGTLDGTIGVDADGGMVYDEDYQQIGASSDRSYFKPIEAYRIKKRIQRDEEKLRTYYEHFDTTQGGMDLGPISALITGIDAVTGGLGDLSNAIQLLTDSLPKDTQLPARLAKRDIANTYVWTADGGFFAETTSLVNSVNETMGSSMSISGSLSAGFSLDISGAAAVGLSMEAGIGAALNITKTKARDTERSFELNMELNVPGNLQKYKDGEPEYDENDVAISQPGKVDAYRFMTFYLSPRTSNFDDFANKVVDPEWLNENSPNANALLVALGSASNGNGNKSAPWRIMHRVTFVSRIQSAFDPVSAPATNPVARIADINSNYELIKRLEPLVQGSLGTYLQLSEAVYAAIENNLTELVEAEEEVVELVSQYYGVFDENTS